MRGRDESLALRSLVAATESHTLAMRAISNKLDAVLAKLDNVITRLDEFHGEFATHRHGDNGEVI